MEGEIRRERLRINPKFLENWKPRGKHRLAAKTHKKGLECQGKEMELYSIKELFEPRTSWTYLVLGAGEAEREQKCISNSGCCHPAVR